MGFGEIIHILANVEQERLYEYWRMRSQDAYMDPGGWGSQEILQILADVDPERLYGSWRMQIQRD